MKIVVFSLLVLMSSNYSQARVTAIAGNKTDVAAKASQCTTPVANISGQRAQGVQGIQSINGSKINGVQSQYPRLGPIEGKTAVSH